MTGPSRRCAIAALALLAWLGAVAQAAAERRVALVLGISAYRNVASLSNARNDAASMVAVLKRAGFDVVEERHDLGITELRRAVREFADTARDADIAVVYYAGHGIEVDGSNYLIPADAKLASDFDVEDETISLDRVLRSLDFAKRLRLVILDACRDNPFAASMKRTVATRAIGRGLAKVEPMSSDTLVAFAARAGAVASDGNGDNSPFTAALVKHIAEPGLDIRIAFGRVRDEVLKATGNRQEPFVYGSLGGSTVALVPAAPQAVDPDAIARADYQISAQVGTTAAWDSFLAAHPTGLFADLARAQRAKVAAGAEAQQKETDLARLRADVEARLRAAEQQRIRTEEETRRTLAELSKLKSAEAARAQAIEEARRKAADLEQLRAADEARLKAADEARRKAEEESRRTAAELARLQTAAQASPGAVVAALTPAKGGEVTSAPAIDPADVARLLQLHLKRVGCDPGSTDGSWGEGSRRALAEFNRQAGTGFDDKLASLDALDGVRSRSGRVCPLACKAGYRVQGDACVQITCESGMALGKDGVCRPHKEPTRAARQEPSSARHEAPARREAPVASRSTAATGKGGASCFNFNGKRFCE